MKPRQAAKLFNEWAETRGLPGAVTDQVHMHHTRVVVDSRALGALVTYAKNMAALAAHRRETITRLKGGRP